MTHGDVNLMMLCAAWAVWSLARLASHVGRSAAALEQLQKLAERGRG